MRWLFNRLRDHQQKASFGLKLTKAGTLYIVMTLLLGFAAVNTGNNLLYFVVSALLGFMAVSGLLGKANIDRLAIEIDPPDEIYDNTPTILRIRLRNHKRWIHSFLLELVLPEGVTLVTLLERGGSVTTTLPATFRGRGERSIEGVMVRSIFPVNFFVRRIRLECRQKLVVFPELREQAYTIARVAGEEGLIQESNQPGVDGDIHQIGEYSGSEPMKMIHWKQSARHDELKVKHLARSSQEPVTLSLDDFTGSLEDRLRAIAFQVNRLCKLERPVGLRLGTRTIPAATGYPHRLRILRELALYDPD